MAITFQSDKLNKNRELVDLIKEKSNRVNGVVGEAESHGAYNAGLPEALTPEIIAQVSDYNTTFVSAAHVAMGEMAADAFNENKDLDKVTGSFGFFGKHDSVDVTVQRERTFNNQMKPGETVTKHLVMSSTVTSSVRGLKTVRNEMSKEFADRFAK